MNERSIYDYNDVLFQSSSVTVNKLSYKYARNDGPNNFSYENLFAVATQKTKATTVAETSTSKQPNAVS